MFWRKKNPFFPPFSACHNCKIQAPPRRLKNPINHFFFCGRLCWVGLTWAWRLCRGYPGCVLGCWCLPLLPFLHSSLALNPRDPHRLHGRLQDLVPQPVPTSPCLLLLWHKVPIYLGGLWTPCFCPKTSQPACPSLGSGSGVVVAGSGDNRGHRRRGRHVPCCCWSWLNIVPGQLGNANRSGEKN